MSDSQVNNKSFKAKIKPKKQNKEKEATSAPSSNETKANVSGDGPASTPPNTALSAWAVADIQRMMHGFGDSRKPLLESARLVESILSQQMKSLLQQAAEVSVLRGAKVVGLEDILFLTRKDKVKLARLVRYLELKSFQGSVIPSMGVDEDAAAAVVGVESVGDSKSPVVPRVKRTKLCRDFLSTIDQTGELVSVFTDPVFDEVKHERDVRAEAHTRCMDQAQYLEYSNARCSSFCGKTKTGKFREWLLKDLHSDIRLHSTALELFSYLAYETVAQIVDLALLVKKDSKSLPGDPLSWSLPPVTCNPEFPNVLLPLPHERNVAATSSEAAGKGEGSSVSELAEPESITPSEIREAMHRYWKQRGSFTCFAKTVGEWPCKRLLCL
ncbi:transcription initiation protein SPT3 homolog [Ornithodoros turicata]|uniref:transcription initiation protein SPT3 homolog n=1 Tax=Ornithodoros turicata TaxID=34597 RepID=UPI003139076A